MSTWLFDLGNTRLKCAALRDGAVDEVLRVDHDRARLADDLGALLPERIDTAFVASVAGPVPTASLLELLARRCSRISLARTQPACCGVRIAYAQPSRLGVDRFLAMLAARARAPRSWLVVGVGTALTIDLLDRDGLHRGGRIAPSPTLMRESLHARAPHLPIADGDYVEFADDTAAALASGCEGAALALVARSVQVASASLGERPGVLLHGGGATALLPLIDAADLAPTLVLEGLARWAGASV